MAEDKDKDGNRTEDESEGGHEPEVEAQDQGGSGYDESNVQVLEGIEHVRKRPAMYIGDTTTSGLHHLVYEVVDNAIDEAMAGACHNITLEINSDGSVAVEDDGRGFPVGIKPGYNMSVLELCLTKLGSGAKFDSNTYKVSGGLHGVGVVAVNALSEWLEVHTSRDGQAWSMRFERGKAVTPLESLGPSDKTGTRVKFLADKQIFPDISFRYETISNRLRELAYLNTGLSISIKDHREEREEVFLFERGIQQFVEHLNEGKTPLHPMVYLPREDREQRLICEIAFQYTDSYSESVLSFANNIKTVEGGSHLSGFRSALTRTINAYARKSGLLREKGPTPTGDDIREGLTAVVSVKVPDPQFEGQTKTKLGNSEVGTFVETTVNEMLGNYLEEHPAETKRIVQKAIQAALAREAARRARETTRKSVMFGGGISRKLVDCSSRDINSTELFIVEGDSAAGSAKGYRDSRTQAILPIRGKILNVEKARLHKVLNHEEIIEIIKALGTGIGSEDFDISKLRYGKIIIMTDADVDGSHIRALLLTLFFRQMRPLIDKGVVYIAQPPLYQLKRGKKSNYVLDDGELDVHLTEFGLKQARLEIRDGAGEPRVLQQERLTELVELIKLIEQQATILGRRGILFRPFIEEHCGNGSFPMVRAQVDGQELFFDSEEAFDEFRRENVAADQQITRQELTECKVLQDCFARLGEFGCSVDDLFLERRELDTGERTPAMFQVFGASGDPIEAANLRQIPEAIRKLAARGCEVKRFKGLGEMNKEQLWETTMDPENRVMRQVVISAAPGDAEHDETDASEADVMFSILMGENVEPRRKFIAKNAIHVKNLDV